MNKQKTIVFLLILLMIIPLMSFTIAKTYPQSYELDLKFPFEVNGTPASSDGQCNISVIYPNETYVRENNAATNLGTGIFNITLNYNETSILGEYNWIAFCCDGDECATGYDDYEITPSGFGAINSGEGMNIAISIFSILFIGIIFFVSCLKSESVAGKFILGGLSGLMFVITILFILVVFTQTLGGYTALIEGYSTFWFVMKTLVVMSILVSILYSGLLALKLWRYKRGFLD